MRSSVGCPIITLGKDPLDRQMDRGPFDYLSRWSISQAVKFRRATLRRQRQMQSTCSKPHSFSFNQTRPPTWYFCGTSFFYYSNINPLSPTPPCFCKTVVIESVNQSNTITARARNKRECVLHISVVIYSHQLLSYFTRKNKVFMHGEVHTRRLTSSSAART